MKNNVSHPYKRTPCGTIQAVTGTKAFQNETKRRKRMTSLKGVLYAYGNKDNTDRSWRRDGHLRVETMRHSARAARVSREVTNATVFPCAYQHTVCEQGRHSQGLSACFWENLKNSMWASRNFSEYHAYKLLKGVVSLWYIFFAVKIKSNIKQKDSQSTLIFGQGRPRENNSFTDIQWNQLHQNTSQTNFP